MPTKAKATRAKKKEEELPFKITDHLLVPKHELMPPDEAAAILKKYNSSPHEFPFVLSTDPAAKSIGAKAGRFPEGHEGERDRGRDRLLQVRGGGMTMSKAMTTKQYDSWAVLRDILQKEGVARQHLNSYNEFIAKGLQSIIDEIRRREIETVSTPYKVKFGRVELGRPRVVEIDGSVSNVFPMEARLRNLSYSSPIYLDMTIEEEGMSREATRQHIGDLPVMVKSDLCQLSKMTKEQLVDVRRGPERPRRLLHHQRLREGHRRAGGPLAQQDPRRPREGRRASPPTRPGSTPRSSATGRSSRPP